MATLSLVARSSLVQVSRFNKLARIPSSGFGRHASTATTEDKLAPADLKLAWTDVALELRDTRLPSFKMGRSSLWLRDHCRCAKCYNSRTHQRKEGIIQTSPPKIVSATVSSREKNVYYITISWSDGHVSEYSMDFLIDGSKKSAVESWSEAYSKRVPWLPTNLPQANLARIDVGSLRDRELALKSRHSILESLWKYGIAYITEVQPMEDDTTKAVEEIAPIMKTTYGELHAFEADLKRADTAYTDEAIGPHTDGTYMTEAPGLQVFHCFLHDGQGGENTLVDGLQIYNSFSQLYPREAELLRQKALPAEYIEGNSERNPKYPEVMNHFWNEDLTFKFDPITRKDLMQIRFNPYDRAPYPYEDATDIEKLYQAYGKLTSMIYDPLFHLTFKLSPGTVVLIDNWRVLHARNSYTGRRVMASGYIARGEYLSQLRVRGIVPQHV